jgi:hypothetical protein
VYYIFDQPSVTKHKLKLLANEQDCEEFFTTAPTFIVVQYVTFSSPWEQNWPYAGDPPAIQIQTNKWNFGGNFYNDGTNTVPGISWPTCSIDYFVNSNMLTNEPTIAWWVSGGLESPAPYSVTLEKGLTFANGRHFLLPKEGAIHMWRPKRKISPLTTSVVVYQDILDFGDPVHGNEGITFYNTINIPTGFSGTKKWVQVGSSRVRTLEDVNSVVHRETQNGAAPYGDTPIPYEVTGAIPDDSPHTLTLTSAYVRAEASNSFEMWMMFEPPGGVWVPLRAVSWSWSGSAINGPGGWALESGSNTVDPPDFETENYPIWKSNIRDHQWIPPL